MRMFLIVGGLVVLAGCASGGGQTYQDELRGLESACQERGGVLTPSGIANTSGRPALDYFCVIRGGSGELSRPQGG